LADDFKVTQNAFDVIPLSLAGLLNYPRIGIVQDPLSDLIIVGDSSLLCTLPGQGLQFDYASEY
jgi:hypothetical protein